MLERAYFVLQAAAAVAWWIGVFTHRGLRVATLGDADPGWLVGPDLALFALPSLLMALLRREGRAIRWVLGILLSWSAGVLLLFGWCSLETGLGAWGVIAMAFAFSGSVVAGLPLALGPLSARRVFPAPLIIRPASRTGLASNLASTFLQILFFWGLFLGVLPVSIAWLERRWGLSWPALSSGRFEIAGWTLFATFGAVGLWAAVTMVARGIGTPLPSATAQRLVTSGPYAFVRNPMAVAGILQGVGVGLALHSWLAVAYAMAGSVVWNLLARPYEEADLLERFGADYEAYRKRVRCWIPWVGC